MKFTVIVKDWLRGQDLSSLLYQGKRCCIGFACKDLGVSDKAMEGRGNPVILPNPEIDKVKPILVTARGTQNDFTGNAIDINDDRNIGDVERMTRLRALAKKHGHQFVFVGTKKVTGGKGDE